MRFHLGLRQKYAISITCLFALFFYWLHGSACIGPFVFDNVLLEKITNNYSEQTNWRMEVAVILGLLGCIYFALSNRLYEFIRAKRYTKSDLLVFAASVGLVCLVFYLEYLEHMEVVRLRKSFGDAGGCILIPTYPLFQPPFVIRLALIGGLWIASFGLVSLISWAIFGKPTKSNPTPLIKFVQDDDEPKLQNGEIEN